MSQPTWTGEDWFSLLGSHLLLSLGAVAIAALLGLVAGVLVTRGAGRRLQPLSNAIFSLAQAVPPVPVIALALPTLGFGAAPTVLALVPYASLPVIRGVVTGLDGVPPAAMGAARGVGPVRRLASVELPFALPVMLAGLRVAVILAIATAVVGAVAGAQCLGTPVVVGLSNGNHAYVVQGRLFTAWLALLVDRALALTERPAARIGGTIR